MTESIKINDLVVAPKTDKEGEVAFVIGKLVDINKRYATVEYEGETFKVGKSKIELAPQQALTNEDKKSGRGRIAQGYTYLETIAASGRKSCDNGDKVAQMLRGCDLGTVYNKVAKVLETEVDVLVAKYSHLNEGQQRMCLGNRLRGFFKKQESEK